MNKKELLFLFITIILAGGITQFAADIYVPSLSIIASDFDSTVNLSQWSVSLYMLGASISQLFYGPASEGFGRKNVILFGMLVIILGSIVCALSQNMQSLIIGRFIQGCGAGAGASLWRSIFRDNFKGSDLSKYGSYLSVFIIFMIPTGPLIGSYIQKYFGWRFIFVFVFIYCIAVILIIKATFTERSAHSIANLKIYRVIEGYKELFRNKDFVRSIIASFITFGSFFCWFVVGPILIIDKLGCNATNFGWINFYSALFAQLLSSYLNVKYVNKFGSYNMLKFGWSVIIFSGLLMLTLYTMLGTNIYGIIAPVILLYFGSSFIWPNLFATAFRSCGHIAGYAGSIYGFMQLLGASVISSLVAYLPDETPLPLALVITTCSSLAWFVFKSISPKAEKAYVN